MIEFTLLLAGIKIGISAIYENTMQFCKEYICEGTPEFTVTIAPDDIAFERNKSAHEDVLEGITLRHFSDEYLETLAVYRKIAERMPDYDTLLFHGSVVAVDGEGYLFAAKSGTGKSTHTRFWRQEFGDRAVMINDDKPLLQIKDGQVWAHGTPWNGKHHLSTNTAVPLKGLCILERGEENHIQPVSARQALPMLLQQSYRPQNQSGLTKSLSLLDQLARRTRFYRLSCNLDPYAARVAYDGMQ